MSKEWAPLGRVAGGTEGNEGPVQDRATSGVSWS